MDKREKLQKSLEKNLPVSADAQERKDRKDINCAIFRHGVLKETGNQIDPHASKEICDSLAKEGKIYGCGKPFKLVRQDSVMYIAQKCEYI